MVSDERSWGILAILILLLFLGLAFSCAQAPVDAGASLFAVRTEVAAGTPGAVAYDTTYDNTAEVWFGPAQPFRLAYAGKTVLSDGNPGIAFEIAASEAKAFSDYTAAHVDQLMAIEVDGRILVAPRIVDRLGPSGVIDGGSNGFTQEELDDIVMTLRTAGR